MKQQIKISREKVEQIMINLALDFHLIIPNEDVKSNYSVLDDSLKQAVLECLRREDLSSSIFLKKLMLKKKILISKRNFVKNVEKIGSKILPIIQNYESLGNRLLIVSK